MRFSVTGRHVDISDAFRASAEEGLKAFCEKYQVEPVESWIVISKDGFSFMVEVKLHLSRNVDLVSSCHHTDAYAGIEGALDILGKRIRRHKKRVADHHKRHDFHGEKEVTPYYVLNGSILSSEEEDTTGEELAPAIVAEVSANIPTLSVGDAVMRMDLSESNAFIFRNSQNRRINFVYRRKDGNIGWMDPNA